jgi:hypothetical protein
MPSWEIFAEQDAAYKESVLPAAVTARVSVEMAATFGWERYVGLKGRNHWHAPLWRLRSLERLAEVFWLYRGCCRRRGPQGDGGRSNCNRRQEDRSKLRLYEVDSIFKYRSAVSPSGELSCNPLEFWKPQKLPIL